MKLTKANLNKLTREELINLSVKIEDLMTEIRGYSGGLKKEMLNIFDNDTLIDLAMKSKRNFKSMGLDLEKLV